MLTLDAAGNVKWDKQIPVPKFAGFTVGPLLVADDSSLVFSATDNISSDLVSVSPSGAVQVQKQLSGKFQFVRPAVSDGILQIWGWLSSNTPTGHTKITLNNQLEEISRETQTQPADYFARVAFRMPDQSLALFGSAVHPGSYTSLIVHVDAALRAEQSLEPPGSRNPILDIGSIWAAAPDSAVGEFVAARTLVVPSGSNNDAPNDIPQDFRRGVVLDFVKFD